MKDFEPISVNCSCGSSNHMAVLYFNSEDKEAYLSMQMSNHRGFFKRLLEAAKYVLGVKSKYGHWDETLLDEQKLTQLRDTISEFLGSNGKT